MLWNWKWRDGVFFTNKILKIIKTNLDISKNLENLKQIRLSFFLRFSIYIFLNCFRFWKQNKKTYFEMFSIWKKNVWTFWFHKKMNIFDFENKNKKHTHIFRFWKKKRFSKKFKISDFRFCSSMSIFLTNLQNQMIFWKFSKKINNKKTFFLWNPLK